MCVSCREKRQRWIFLQGRVRGWFHESAERQKKQNNKSNWCYNVHMDTGWKMEWFKNGTFTLGLLEGEHRMYYRHFCTVYFYLHTPTLSLLASSNGYNQHESQHVPFFLKWDISGTPWRYSFNFDSNCPLRTQGWNDVSISTGNEKANLNSAMKSIWQNFTRRSTVISLWL